VFCGVDLKAGEVIEICPVLVVPENETELLDETVLYNYVFIWGDDDQKGAIVFGYGSMYNHAYEPNAEYKANYEDDTFTVYALKDIAAGEEIYINYNGDPSNKKLVWFDKEEKE
jgi:SET domain-containing protein